MKLEIELVPEFSWYSNMRKVMTKEEWDKLRKSVYAEYNYQCGICESKGMLHCHEIWKYDDVNYTQTLSGFIALCPMCHHVKHIGFAGILADRGELNFDDVIAHFIKVNECDIGVFNKHYLEAFEQWENRSNHLWNINLGEYKYLQKSEGTS